MPAILLRADVVRFRDPIARNSHLHEWWAEGGLICWRDTEAGPGDLAFGTNTVRDTLLRLQGLNDMIGNSRNDKGWNRPDEMAAYRSYIDQMIKVCETARHQGMPDNPQHAKQLVAEVKARRQSRMVVPGLAACSW